MHKGRLTSLKHPIRLHINTAVVFLSNEPTCPDIMIPFGVWAGAGAPVLLTFCCLLSLGHFAVERPLESFLALHGTRRFITEFTRALHLSLS
jgi:hypothetical protein